MCKRKKEARHFFVIRTGSDGCLVVVSSVQEGPASPQSPLSL